jgi:hypothetical protein
MPKPAIDATNLTRIDTNTAELEWLHLWGTDEEIDKEFNSVCRTIWGYTLDDFDDDCIAKEDHDWLDELTARRAYRYAAAKGYDLGDYGNGEMALAGGIGLDDPRRRPRFVNAGTKIVSLEEARRTAARSRNGHRNCW